MRRLLCVAALLALGAAPPRYRGHGEGSRYVARPVAAQSAAAATPSTLNNGVVAYWKFDGNATDSVAGTYTGSVGGTAPTYSAGKLGSGIGWGANGSISIPPLTTGAVFTIRLWGKPPTGNNYSSGFGTVIAQTNGLQTLYFVGVHPQFYNKTAAAASLTAQVWHHVVVIANGSNVNYWIDGVLDSSTPAMTVGSTLALIGASSLSGGGDPFRGVSNDGMLDEIAVYNRAWTPAEVAEDYNAGAGKTYPF